MLIAVVAVLFLVLLSHSVIPVQGSRFPAVKRGPLQWKKRILRFTSTNQYTISKIYDAKCVFR